MIRKAQQGFALLDLIFVCGIIGLLASIALPQLALAKNAAGAASAVGSMRALGSAQLTFALTCGGGFYAPKLTTLATPPPASVEGYIGGGLGDSDTVVKSGYTIHMTGTAFPGAPPSCNGVGGGEAAQGFVAAADPNDPLNPRFFAINSNNAIYEHTATLWGVMPEMGDPPVGTPLVR
ncbi:MAG TPA: type II secretion system protein [Vicinamibacterales bacterium]|nr:type II secretion system protein [Vicinamibacterales bacterium]